MRRTLRRTYGPLIACLASVAFSPVSTARAQDLTPPSIVDGVVNAVCQKQIVLLGQLPTHGEALNFDAKSKIANRLIAQCGFTAILFEAPVYDFLGFERAAHTRSATQDHLDNSIGRFWLTRELTPWRRALFDAATRQRVTVGGLDDQISITSHYARTMLPRMIAAASSESTAAECRDTVSRHVNWTYDAQNRFDEHAQLRLQQCARNAADTAASSRSFDAADRVMLESFARYADRQRSGATTTDRDESMFRNLVWYLDRLPANSRIVIWTATSHAARQRGPLPWTPMGARVVERWGDRVAAVGFTAYRGHSAPAARPATPIADAPPDSLEATATRESAWALLNADKLRAMGRIPSRLFGKVFSEPWSDYFDAIVVIRQEVAPTFDPWKPAPTSSLSAAQNKAVSDAIPSKRMPDGKLWTTTNVKVDVAGSSCHGNSEDNCARYGRLYTWESAKLACPALGDGWRLPTNDEWQQMAKHFGGVRGDSADDGKGAFNALMIGGSSGFNAMFGGNRDVDGQYARLEAHGFYWTASPGDADSAWLYNLGKNGKILNRHSINTKLAASVRCVRD